MTANRYDSILYPTHAHDRSHPDRLATMATLFGMQPAPVERCRVLELGCNNGSNLVPMAWSLPESEFVGVDLALAPITRARQMADSLGLKNITFRQANIADIGADLGKFDYIIAHGVYSWVPAEVRDRILAICQTNLNEQGVAFVSYNTYPGHRLKEMVREMMLFHVSGFEDPQKQVTQSIALARFIAEAQTEEDVYRRFLKELMETLIQQDANYILHDWLEDVNAPVYFHQFCEHAGRHGLQYLGEADFREMLDCMFNPQVTQTLNQLSSHRIVREQYLDFLKCRQFRQTLLCRADVKLDLSFKPDLAPRFYVVSSARPESPEPQIFSMTPEKFVGSSGGSIRTSFPVMKAALMLLAEQWPQPIHFSELVDAAVSKIANQQPVPPAAKQGAALEVGKTLMQGFALGVIDLHLYRPPFTSTVSERPIANPVAQWQARHGSKIATGLYHKSVKLEDEIGRQLVLLMDGTRDRAALAADLFAALQRVGVLPMQDQGESKLGDAKQMIADELDGNLEKLARLGLLSR